MKYFVIMGIGVVTYLMLCSVMFYLAFISGMIF